MNEAEPLAILVVDDDPLVRRSLSRGLRRWSVDAPNSYDAALQALQTKVYDAAVVDVNLWDRRSGVDLAREARRLGVDVSLVVLGAAMSDEIRAGALAAGADCAADKRDVAAGGLPTLILDAVRSRRGTSRGATVLTRALQIMVDEALAAMADEEACAAERTLRLVSLARAAADQPAGTSRMLSAAAIAVGMKRQSLYGYSVVGERWSREQLWHLLYERRNARGERISFSHLEAIAAMPPAKGDVFLERVYREALTVAQVRKALADLGRG